MAGEALAAPLLLGLGLDEFSMSATSILAQRKRIRELSYEESKKVAEKATTELSTMEEVVEHLYNKECNGKVVITDEIKAAIDEYYDKYGVK